MSRSKRDISKSPEAGSLSPLQNPDCGTRLWGFQSSQEPPSIDSTFSQGPCLALRRRFLQKPPPSRTWRRPSALNGQASSPHGFHLPHPGGPGHGHGLTAPWGLFTPTQPGEEVFLQPAPAGRCVSPAEQVQATTGGCLSLVQEDSCWAGLSPRATLRLSWAWRDREGVSRLDPGALQEASQAELGGPAPPGSLPLPPPLRAPISLLLPLTHLETPPAGGPRVSPDPVRPDPPRPPSF